MRQSQIDRYPFHQHLDEARYRLLISLGFLLLSSVVGYFLFDYILSILLQPIDQPLFYSSPAGGLDFRLQISLFFGCLISIPVVLYQILQFILPVVSENIKNKVFTILGASCLLLISGMLFAYYISLPAALYFLNKFNTDQIQSLISTTEYLHFVTRYIFGFGLLFQLPLVLVVINSIKKISTNTLQNYQKWVILFSFVVSAILTPTADVFNLLVMAIPLITLYELSVVILFFVNKKTVKS